MVHYILLITKANERYFVIMLMLHHIQCLCFIWFKGVNKSTLSVFTNHFATKITDMIKETHIFFCVFFAWILKLCCFLSFKLEI
jgi:hypothetical protein